MSQHDPSSNFQCRSTHDAHLRHHLQLHGIPCHIQSRLAQQTRCICILVPKIRFPEVKDTRRGLGRKERRKEGRVEKTSQRCKRKG